MLVTPGSLKSHTGVPGHHGRAKPPKHESTWHEMPSASAACDTSAIRFRPRIGGVPLPEVDAAACNGCGACIAPCPVSAVQRVAGTPAQLPELP